MFWLFVPKSHKRLCKIHALAEVKRGSASNRGKGRALKPARSACMNFGGLQSGEHVEQNVSFHRSRKAFTTPLRLINYL